MNSQHNYGNHDLTSYDTSAVGWGATASSAWYEVIKRDFLAGEYVWTGFDYIGEPTPWNDPYGSLGQGGTWPLPKILILELLIRQDFRRTAITSTRVSGMTV